MKGERAGGREAEREWHHPALHTPNITQPTCTDVQHLTSTAAQQLGSTSLPSCLPHLVFPSCLPHVVFRYFSLSPPHPSTPSSPTTSLPLFLSCVYVSVRGLAGSRLPPLPCPPSAPSSLHAAVLQLHMHIHTCTHTHTCAHTHTCTHIHKCHPSARHVDLLPRPEPNLLPPPPTPAPRPIQAADDGPRALLATP